MRMWTREPIMAKRDGKSSRTNMILLDPDVKTLDDKLAGINTAKVIQEKNIEIPIVLVTGDEWPEKSLPRTRTQLGGDDLKPVTYDKLASALGSLERVGHARRSVPITENGQKSIEFVQDMSRAAADRRALPEVLHGILEEKS